MKTINTAIGTRQIEDWDPKLVQIQLREVLQELRSNVIDKIIAQGLEAYIHTRFQRNKPEAQMLWKIKNRLQHLRNSGIDIDNYRTILDTVLQKDYTHIDTGFVYAEIDQVIHWNLQPELFDITIPVRVDDIDFLQTSRKNLVDKVLNEQGLKDYVYGMYGAKLNDRPKVHYLLDELRDYFLHQPVHYKDILEYIRDHRLALSEGLQQCFDDEMRRILDKHFDRDFRMGS